MMRRRQRGEVLDAPEIPLDLQIEIVNRLPIKSLVRFKCVSKLWYSLIHSKGFFLPSPPRLYISSENNHATPVLLSFTSASNSTAFELDLTIDGIGEYDGRSSCNMVALRGLILYTIWPQVFIYNPTTGQRISLPALNILAEKAYVAPGYKTYVWRDRYFFGYDPILDQYKVVCTALESSGKFITYQTQHFVFVLEARSSWKRIEFDHPHYPATSRQGLCINGVIYYLAESFVSRPRLIVSSFDVRYEEFNTIQVPTEVHKYDRSSWDLMELIHYDGKPSIFDYAHLRGPSGLLNIWVLEDAGRWSRKSLVLQHFQKHLVCMYYFEAIGTTQNGEVVLKPHLVMPNHYYILYYDLHKNDVRRFDVRGISKFPLDLALMDTGENIMHLKI